MPWSALRLKFRLSTILLLTVIVAISLAWFVEYRSRHRRGIVGKWVYPTPQISLVGYSTLLELRRDGTFTKTQHNRRGWEVFEGTYALQDDGQIMFEVTQKTAHTALDEILERTPVAEKLDQQVFFRCAVDQAGYLLLSRDYIQWSPERDREDRLQWEEAYAPATKH